MDIGRDIARFSSVRVWIQFDFRFLYIIRLGFRLLYEKKIKLCYLYLMIIFLNRNKYSSFPGDKRQIHRIKSNVQGTITPHVDGIHNTLCARDIYHNM